MLLFMTSLSGHNSWLQNHEPRSISSIEEFFDGFLRHFQACPALNIQEEAFIDQNHDEQERGSSLVLHDERWDDNSESMCDREGEFVESEVRVIPTFPKDTIYSDLPFGKLGEGDLIAPSNIDINDYLHIKEGKWRSMEIVLTRTLFMTPMTVISIGPSSFLTILGL